MVLAIPGLPLHHLSLAQGDHLQVIKTQALRCHLRSQRRRQRRHVELRTLGPAYRNRLPHLVGQEETCIPTGALEGYLLEGLRVEKAEL